MASITLTAGDDSFTGSGKVDYVEAQAGNDRVWGGGAGDHLWGGEGDDTLFGESGADRLHGDAGSDRLWGQGGNDWFYLSGDGDEAHGGVGRDRAVYLQRDTALTLDMANGTGPDLFDSIEDVDATQFADTITGDDGDNRLRGHGGADSLSGGDGDDILIGGEDSDRLEGGAGDDVMVGTRSIDFRRDDVFVFHVSGESLDALDDLGDDLVRDFVPGEDALDLLVRTGDGGLGGREIFDRVDSDGDGIWNGADAAVSVRIVELDDGSRALSTVVDLGDALDPDGSLVAIITFFGTVGIGRGDVLDTQPI